MHFTNDIQNCILKFQLFLYTKIVMENNYGWVEGREVGKVTAGTRRFNLIDFNHVPIPISQIYARIIKASHLIAFFV